jgi:tetratricopeptide (TPR) repeat protein
MSSDANWLTQAVGYLELDLPRQALECLANVSEDGRRREAFHFHNLSAEALRRLDRHREAVDHLLQALRDKPADAGCRLSLGWCAKRSGRLDLAVEALREAERICRLKKDDELLPLVLYNLSCYLSLAGEREEMLHRLAAALELKPDFRDAIPEESDFDRFRDDPDFQRLASG